jgi:DNA-binding NarL/FixJ family response regulator
MAAVAILSADPLLRRSLEQLSRDEPTVTLVCCVDRLSDLLRLMSRDQVDIVLMDAPTPEHLQEWQAAGNHTVLLVLLRTVTAKDTIEALNAGATAVLRRSASRSEILAAIVAATRGLAVLPAEQLAALLDHAPVADELLENGGSGRAELTHRELEVLGAMANGASNKAIARQLGISFHTVKFHVAAILAKLDAESRTEAVIKAAQAGLVML